MFSSPLPDVGAGAFFVGVALAGMGAFRPDRDKVALDAELPVLGSEMPTPLQPGQFSENHARQLRMSLFHSSLPWKIVSPG
jgi:hypothetical protein